MGFWKRFSINSTALLKSFLRLGKKIRKKEVFISDRGIFNKVLAEETIYQEHQEEQKGLGKIFLSRQIVVKFKNGSEIKDTERADYSRILTIYHPQTKRTAFLENTSITKIDPDCITLTKVKELATTPNNLASGIFELLIEKIYQDGSIIINDLKMDVNKKEEMEVKIAPDDTVQAKKIEFCYLEPFEIKERNIKKEIKEVSFQKEKDGTIEINGWKIKPLVSPQMVRN